MEAEIQNATLISNNLSNITSITNTTETIFDGTSTELPKTVKQVTSDDIGVKIEGENEEKPDTNNILGHNMCESIYGAPARRG